MIFLSDKLGRLQILKALLDDVKENVNPRKPIGMRNVPKGPLRNHSLAASLRCIPKPVFGSGAAQDTIRD